ncbi:hypothetical protein EON64_12675 [archaeon]|nr:MAG: hypothetical protein EON64_12675 [archaeon]
MSSKPQLPPPPVFGVLGDDKASKTGIYSLVDIFDDFLFSGDKGSGVVEQKEVEDDFDSYDEDGDDSLDSKRRKRSRQLQRNMTEEQKIERRCACVAFALFSVRVAFC